MALPITRPDPIARPGPIARPDPFTALYREHHQPLLAFVARLTGGDRQWAEDVVQETMTRAWRNADRLDPAASPLPWLATVARRIVIDDVRRRRDGTPLPDAEDPAVPDGTDGLLRKVVICDALGSLSAAHRQVLVETVLRDRTIAHAAAVLGIPEGTVKSRVHYAMRAMRDALERRGVTR